MPNYNDIEDQRRSYDAMYEKATKLERENKVLKLRIRGLEARQDDLSKTNVLHQIIDGMLGRGILPPSDGNVVYAVMDERNPKRLDSIWLWEHRAVERMKQLTSRYAELDTNAVCIEVDRLEFSAPQLLAYWAAHKAGLVDGLGCADGAQSAEADAA